jgi:signal transduction histidine kinase
MASGDLDARLPGDEDDELGALARDFNVMADRVQALVVSLRAEEARQKTLFATFTHEIGTPLTSVLGYLEALAMPEVDADEATRRRYVAVAYERARQLDALADDLTTLSRLDWDGLPLDRTAEDLGALARREVEALAPEAAARPLTVRVEEGAAVADVDPVRLGQVIRNLLTNAIRHATPGTDVVLAARVVGDEARLTVTDRGEGIAPEHLARLGEPLYRPDASRDRATGGRGLGLAISRGIVRAHGGTLEIRSTVGRGTTVEIRIPMRAPASGRRDQPDR